MPKYIKDGAYTIVVDDRSVSPKRTASPKADDDSASEDEYGNFRESRDEFQVEEDEWAREEEEEEQEENIDYADPSFILQNLKLATPDFSQDKTYLLPCREDLSKIICSQVRFYCFCALDAFLRNPKAVSILIIGEGFIGARIINDLISNGCRDALRVCTRGDLTAEEWRARGIKADNDLPVLLNGEQPDIVIITVENASFTTICRQLTANYVLSASSFIISCSFGFQRRKLHAQLHTPNIFRSFVEPEQIYSKYKKNAFSSILAFTKTEISNMMTDSVSIQSANSFKAIPALETAALPVGVTAEEYDGASCISKRSLDVRNIVYQLENFYAIQHHGFSEARNKALKNAFGVYIDAHGVETGKPSSPGRGDSSQATGSRKGAAFAPPTDESYEAMSIRKAMKTEAKLRSRLESMIRKLGEFNACSFSYQTQFRSTISEEDMQVLKAQQYTREENNPKSGPNMGYQKYKHSAREGADAPARKTIADLPGRSMYDADFIEAIFRNDEDYSSFTGPGFDLMTSWDTKPERKGGSTLNQLHALTGTASSDSSVVSGTFKGMARAHKTPPPHHVYRSPTQSVAPLSHSHSSVHGQHGHIQAGGDSGSAGSSGALGGGHGGPGRPAHSVRASRMQEPLSEEAAQELAEFGRRLSHYADHEGTKIDQNYMQKYLDVSTSNLG